MFKIVFAVAFCIVIASADPAPKPGLLPVAAAYTAPVVAPAIVTAQSSQVFSRNYNGLVAAPVAPVVAAAPFVSAPHYIRSAPLVAAAPAPLAYAAPHYHYSPYAAQPLFV